MPGSVKNENQNLLKPAELVLSSFEVSINLSMMFLNFLFYILGIHAGYQIESLFFKDFKNHTYFAPGMT